MALKRTTRTLLARSKARKGFLKKKTISRSKAASALKNFKKSAGPHVASRLYINPGHDVQKNRNTALDVKHRGGMLLTKNLVKSGLHTPGRVRSDKRVTPRRKK